MRAPPICYLDISIHQSNLIVNVIFQDAEKHAFRNRLMMTNECDNAGPFSFGANPLSLED